MKVIYLVGIERSGTNYLEWLLKENFKDLIVLLKWKHYAPRNFIEKVEWNGKFQGDKVKENKEDIEKYLNDISIIGRSLPPFSIVSSKTTQNIVHPNKGVFSDDVKKHTYDAILNGRPKKTSTER